MPNIGKVNVVVGASTAALTSGLAQAGKSLDAFAGKATGIFSGLGAGVLGIAGVAGLGAGISGALSMVDSAFQRHRELVKEAAGLGLAPAALAQLKAAFKPVSDSLVPALQHLEAELGAVAEGSDEAAKKFEKMGLEALFLTDLSVDQVLMRIADQVKNAGSAFEQARIAQQAFGRAGKELLPILKQGAEGIRANEERLKAMNITLTEGFINAETEAAELWKWIGTRPRWFLGQGIVAGRAAVAPIAAEQERLEADRAAREARDFAERRALELHAGGVTSVAAAGGFLDPLTGNLSAQGERIQELLDRLVNRDMAKFVEDLKKVTDRLKPASVQFTEALENLERLRKPKELAEAESAKAAQQFGQDAAEHFASGKPMGLVLGVFDRLNELGNRLAPGIAKQGLTEDQFALASASEFEKLEKHLDAGNDLMAGALKEGSQETFSVLNKWNNRVDREDPAARVERVMRESLRVEQEHLIEARRLNEAFKKFRQPVPVRI